MLCGMSAVHEANTVSERELLRPRFGPFFKGQAPQSDQTLSVTGQSRTIKAPVQA